MPEKTIGGKPQIGAGKKRRPLEERILEGSKKRPIKVISFAQENAVIAIEPALPHDFLATDQVDQISGKLEETYAKRIYEEAYEWMKSRHVAHLVPKLLLERYASEAANWINCLLLVRQHGHFIKNAKKDMLEVSPWAKQAQAYGSRSDQLWNQIYLTIRDNSSVRYEGETPHEDVMSSLLGW